MLAEECMFSYAVFKVFPTNTVKCFETTLILNSHTFSSSLSSFSWKALNQVRNLALTVLDCNSGPRKKFWIFLKPSGCLSLIILFLVHTPEAEHASPHLCSYRGPGGSPREISQASGWFSLTPVTVFTFWWGQRLATATWHARISQGMCFVHNLLICGPSLADTSHFLRGFLKPPCFLINTHLFLSITEPLSLGFIFPEYVWEYLVGCGHLHDYWGFVMEYRACHLQVLNQQLN